ncbi:MAG: ornithine carbamoyltransferase [bacterium]
MKKDFLGVLDLTEEEIRAVLARASQMKARTHAGEIDDSLRAKTLAMIFHKPSLRTRVSFETGMAQQGGHAVYIEDKEIGMGKRETIEDIARVLSRYVDAIMIRTFGHDIAEGLARAASVPVINGLTDYLHPCQILADILTVQERLGTIDGMTVAFLGDGNNVANSWIEAAIRLPFQLTIGVPRGFEPDAALLAQARNGRGSVRVVNDPREAVYGANVLYTDVWASMGQEADAERKAKSMRPFQVNDDLLGEADPGAIVLHCLPAHRGEEITHEVIEGPRSAVFDEAENRLHVQKALVTSLILRK